MSFIKVGLVDNFLRLKRDSVSLGLLGVSLILYGVRVRGNFQVLWIVENSAFILGLLFFPWNRKFVIRGLIWVGALYIFGLISWYVFYPTQNDIATFLINTTQLTKCLLLAFILSHIPAQKLYQWLFHLVIGILLLAVGILLMRGFSADHGFSGNLGDRNYFAAYVALMYASLQMLNLEIKDKIQDRFILLIMQATLIGMVLLTASRSGLLAILWLALIRLKKINWILVLAVVGIMYSFDLLQPILYRMQHTAIGTEAEQIRLFQYRAFIDAFVLNPVGIIFGFGPAASSHLNWFWQSYQYGDLDKYRYILHNTSLEWILSFGLFGFGLLIRFFQVLNWKFLIFFLLISSFNNLVCFLPLYVFIGVALAIDRSTKYPSAQY